MRAIRRGGSGTRRAFFCVERRGERGPCGRASGGRAGRFTDHTAYLKCAIQAALLAEQKILVFCTISGGFWSDLVERRTHRDFFSAAGRVRDLQPLLGRVDARSTSFLSLNHTTQAIVVNVKA